ncbi:MAG: 3-dehydroquinate synthase family protein [Bacteroidota bacterium]
MNVDPQPHQTLISGPRALHTFGEWLAHSGFEHGAILCDAFTAEHSLPLLRRAAPFLNSWPVLVVPRGEPCKSIAEATRLWHQLTEYRIGRKDLLINLGGGSLTDLGGFVASTYLRGISFVHVPTTLLGMVDAALGGKTGIDLESVKNRIGTIVFPQSTVCDPVFLKTLPDEGWLDGLAESVKHAIVADKELWKIISDSPDVRDALVNNLDRIQLVKLRVVEQDPFEKEQRMILNFGHSVGHGIESCALEAELTMMTHGRAVAMGMVIESRIALQMGLLSVLDSDSIAARITRHFGELNLSWMNPDRLVHFLRLDKKNSGGTIRMSLPECIGSCRTGVEVSEELVISVLSENSNRP